jgi:hypothetical protein
MKDKRLFRQTTLGRVQRSFRNQCENAQGGTTKVLCCYNFRSVSPPETAAILQLSKVIPMKISTQWLQSAIAFFLAIFLSSSMPALADSYEIFSLGSANGTSLYGMDSTGAVVTYNSMCAVTSISCFETYVDGTGVSGSNFAPTMSWDNGSACGASLLGLITSGSACNGEWSIFGNYAGNNGLLGGLYSDTGSGFDFLHAGSVDKIFVNSDGDIAWVDGLDEQIYEAVNVPTSTFGTASLESLVPAAETPEPGSLLLVGTGLVGLTAAIRSRINRTR